MYASPHIDKLRNCIEVIICCLNVYELESVIQCSVDTTVCSHSRTAFLRSSFIIPDRTDTNVCAVVRLSTTDVA